MEDDCDWNKFFYTSKEVKSDNPGASPFEINYRAIIAMREIGKVFTGLSNFCGFMNLPPPMNVKAFNDMQEKITSTYAYVADGSMENAANEFIPEQGQGNENIADNIADIITVSNDGSWQKRGHSSLNGVVTVVASDSGKCVDFCVLTETCNACTSWEKQKNSELELYEQFMETHNCPINH